MTEPFLELVDISKSYPGVVALDHVGLAVSPGEVIALIGENGAGKSTLMKVLGGVVEPSGGHIRVDGVERSALTVAEAIAAGIAFVHQELNLFDNLDVAGNVFIGREPVHGGPLRLIDRKAPGQASRLQDEHRAALAAMVENGPIPAVHGVVRWRIIDLCQWGVGGVPDPRVQASLEPSGGRLRPRGDASRTSAAAGADAHVRARALPLRLADGGSGTPRRA